MKANNPSVPAKIEIIFDICYLTFALCAGVYYLINQHSTAALLYGIMTLCLVGGDAFHLVPRIRAQATNTMATATRALGIGKLVTSVTMTVFYVLLYHIWCTLYQQSSFTVLPWLIYILAAVRIILCLFPQNEWTSPAPPVKWGIIRNIPFAILGLLILILFAFHSDGAFSFMWLAILISFGCYLPVTLFAQKYPKLGMLMLPKTCAYIWIVCMGFSLL